MNRRGFLAASAAAAAVPLAPNLAFLAPLSRLAAADTQIDPGQVRLVLGIEPLVKLIRNTPRARCIPVFIEQLRAGLITSRAVTPRSIWCSSKLARQVACRAAGESGASRPVSSREEHHA